MCNAIEVFLAIVPPMEEIATDHGSGDFGEMFTQLLESYGIRHGGKLPHRSQAQGTVELANKLLQNQINKVCAGMGTYKLWHKSLPKVVMAINSFHPYRCPYSRTQLLFSVFYYCPSGGPVCLKNPVLTQKVLYKNLNQKRVDSLLKAKGSIKKKNWSIGQFVTLSQNKTNSLVDKIASPRCSNIYKILDIHKQGFSAWIMNILTGAKLEVLSSRLRELSLSDLEHAHFGSPELYKKLAQLTLRMRNKYQAGKQLPRGLQLLRDWPGETLEDMNVVGNPEPDILDVTGNDGVEEGDRVKTEEDQVVMDTESTAHENLEGAAYQNLDSESEDVNKGDGNTYNTRFRGKKHVAVYTVDVMRQNIRSILKYGQYNGMINQNIDLLRTLSREAFCAHKQALIDHHEMCHISLCNICLYFNRIRSYSYDAKGYARYVMPFSTTNVKAMKDKKVVRFQVSNLSEKPMKGFQINFTALEAACAFNVSLRETRLISYLK